MIDPANSLNVMRALQGSQAQQARGGENGQGAGLLPPQIQQFINGIMQLVQQLMQAGKKDGNTPTEGDKQQMRNAVDGVQNGRLSQERQQMAGG